MEAKNVTLLNSLTTNSTLTVPSIGKTLKKTSRGTTLSRTVGRFNINRRSVGGMLTATLRGKKSCTSLFFRRAFAGMVDLGSKTIGDYGSCVSFNVKIHILTNSRANCTCIRGIALSSVLGTTHATTHVTSNGGGCNPMHLTRGALGGGCCPVAAP